MTETTVRISTPTEVIALPASAVKIELTDEASLIAAGNIRAEMGRFGVSQERIAAVIGKSQSVTSKRLRGEIPWDFDDLSIVAETLKVPIAVLLAGIDQLTAAA
jgi:hypothetical protein